MTPITPAALQNVTDRASLFAFLRMCLGWPIPADDTFVYPVPAVEGVGAVIGQIVPFSGDDPFVILLLESAGEIKRSELRATLAAVKRQMRTMGAYEGKGLEDLLFVCVGGEYASVTLAHFRERAGRQPRLATFGWERAAVAETRTLCEVNLPALRLGRNLLGEPDWTPAVRDAWHAAFDVDRVTKDFFKEYKQTFDAIMATIGEASGPVAHADLHTFTLTLMNRLLFCWFIQRKGWFARRRAYLTEQWEQCHITDIKGQGDCDQGGEAFYREWLRPLFLQMLNTPVADRDPAVAARLGDIPYLNGGLFEENERDKRAVPGDPASAIHVPNAALDLLLSEREDAERRPRGLFRRWHFTVQESTPLDVEVAVDPEMLGKVFEELMNELTAGGGDTKRHATGAYYTPRAIVSFMCKEGLKGYLGAQASRLPNNDSHDGAGGTPAVPAAIERFVDEHDASGLTDPEGVLKALQGVKACDPACGSGAYLLGMLQELMALRRELFKAKGVDPKTDYKKKLEIIEHSLYGVDIEPAAVEVARLRLWLALAVEFDDGGDPMTVPPLPNLDFKVECGDSLAAPAWQREQMTFADEDIKKLAALKAAYVECSDPAKKADLRGDIETWEALVGDVLARGGVTGFDWWVRFVEVMDTGGFDIVLANPPYVRQELIKEQKPGLQRTYGGLYSGTADLYVYFYYRALELLKPNGMLVFISSNKWLKAGYGAKLRGHLAATAQVRSITDFGDLPVFQTAIAYPMIIVAGLGAQASRLLNVKGNDDNESRRDACAPRYTQVKSLDDPYPDVKALIEAGGTALPVEALAGETWRLGDADTLQIIRRMETGTVPLGEYVGGRIYYGIKTGLNAAFFIDGATRAALIAADARSEEIVKPLLLGKDIGRWHAERRDRWLIFTRQGIQMEEYPAVHDYLRKWKAQLMPRPVDWDNKHNGEWPGRKPGPYEWYEIQDNIAYWEEFAKPKILYQEIATYQAFAYDTTGALTNNKVFLIPGADLYLLAILNSQQVFDFLVHSCAKLQGGAFAMQYPFVSRIPIHDASPADRAALAALAEACLAKRGAGCEAEEAEINARVAALYGV